jgi:hypothetical protein
MGWNHFQVLIRGMLQGSFSLPLRPQDATIKLGGWEVRHVEILRRLNLLGELRFARQRDRVI